MTQDSLVRVSAPGYDKTISTNSAARLKYQDDDDGAIITVGSSTELVQRLEEPVPQKPRETQQSSRNPMSIATLLAESQQTPPSLTHHIFDIEDREEVRKLWQDIQVKNNTSKASADAAMNLDGETKPLSRDSLDIDQRLQAEKNSEFARVYDKLRPTIWSPLARELGISWREAENMHWSLGEDTLRDGTSAEIFEPLGSTNNEASDSHEAKSSTCSIDLHSESSPSPSPEFSEYRALHFKSTMPPQLRSVESIGTSKSHAAGGQMRSTLAAKPAANLTIEGKRQAQAAGDKLRARTMPSRHRIVATAVDHTNHQNRWATYKSPSSAFFPKDDPAPSQNFDSPGLTSEGKRQAQVAGDKLRNRTNPIRHSRPSRGSVSEHGISKNRWSSYGPRVTRLDERRDSQAESSEKSLPGDAGLSENKGQPSLLELFEVELAKKMSTDDSCHENAAVIVSGVSTTTSAQGKHAVPAQQEAHREPNLILNGLRSINNDLQGLALRAEDLPQEFPRAIGQGFRAALGGLSVFVRSVTNGLQEASALTRQAAEHTREANLQAIDDTVLHLRTVAGEVTALSREILPALPKTNEDSKEDKVRIVPTASNPPTITAEAAKCMLTESKTTEAVYTAPNGNLQSSFASDLESPGSVADRITTPKPSSPPQAIPSKYVSEIPVSITRSIRTDNRRLSRCTGMGRAPHYHKPGPIHLPQHSPLAQSFMGEAQKISPRSGYVDHLRHHQSVETVCKAIEEPDKSQSTNSPAAATRFPTLAQFEDQNFASDRTFPPLPSMNMEPLVPLKRNSQPASQTSASPSPVLSEDRADNSRSVSAAKNLLGKHGIDSNNLSKDQFQSFRAQNPAVQQKSIQIYAANLAKRQRQQNISMTGGAASDPELPVAAPNMSEDGINASAGRRPLQDYQTQLMLLEQQNKRRLLLARAETSEHTGEVGGRNASDAELPVTAPDMAEDGIYASAEGRALNDYQTQLMLLEQQNKWLFLLRAHTSEDTGEADGWKCETVTVSNVQMPSKALPESESRRTTLEERDMELERTDGLGMKRQAIARQELDEISARSSRPEGPSISLSDVHPHPGIPPNSPNSGGRGNDNSQQYNGQSNIVSQQYSEKSRDEAPQEKKALSSEPIQQPNSFHSKSLSGAENNDQNSLLYQSPFSGMTSDGQKTPQGRMGREEQCSASNHTMAPAEHNMSTTSGNKVNVIAEESGLAKPCASSGWKWECAREGCDKKFDTQQERSWHLHLNCGIPRKPDSTLDSVKIPMRHNVSQASDTKKSHAKDARKRHFHSPGFLRTPSPSGMKLTCMAPDCQKKFDTEKEASAHLHSACQSLSGASPQNRKPHSLGFLRTPSATGIQLTCMAPDCQKKFDTEKEASAHLHSACQSLPGPHTQSSAQEDSPSTRSEVGNRFTPQQSMSDGSSAARLAKPFDPLEAEPAARPHLTEGIRRNATVACTDNRLNARRRRPYSEAFDGNGRVDWGQFLKNVPNTQRDTVSSNEREESVRKSPNAHRRTLGSKFSFESDDKDYRPDTHRVHRGSYYDLPDSGYPRWNDGHRDVPKSASPAPVPAARRPYALRSDLRFGTDVPSFSTRSPTPAPTMHFESPEQKRKIQSCVMQLKGLGFGNDGVNGEERLMQCSAAAGGDLIEAIDMIDEEQRAYRDRDLAMKLE